VAVELEVEVELEVSVDGLFHAHLTRLGPLLRLERGRALAC
jgi:hypothetical protein